MHSYEMTVRVCREDIDALGHVNNVVYLRWVQDVATAHWERLTSVEEREATVWVVRRHEIDYRAAAVADDDVVLRTRVGVASGITFERHTEIVRAADGKLLARARTLWCPVHPATGRPQRIDPALRAQFSTGEE